MAQPGHHRGSLWWDPGHQRLQVGQGQGQELLRAGIDKELELAGGSPPL